MFFPTMEVPCLGWLLEPLKVMGHIHLNTPCCGNFRRRILELGLGIPDLGLIGLGAQDLRA